MMGIREGIQEFITSVMTAVLTDPLGLVLVLAWLALMLMVGIITSMRWTGRFMRRIFTQPRRKPTMWSADPRPIVPTWPPSAPPGAVSRVPVPVRPGPGPRDWKQNLH